MKRRTAVAGKGNARGTSIEKAAAASAEKNGRAYVNGSDAAPVPNLIAAEKTAPVVEPEPVAESERFDPARRARDAIEAATATAKSVAAKAASVASEATSKKPVPKA